MQTVGIKELKDKLSQMPLSVKAGQDLVITERGHPIGRIIPEGTATSGEMRSLAELAAKGLVRLPEDSPGDEPDLIEIRGRPLSETVGEGRR